MGKRDGKTEAPTPKRKQDARRKGQVTRSQDLAGWLALLVATYLLPWTITWVGRPVRQALAEVRTAAAHPASTDAPVLLGQALIGGLIGVAPILGVLAAVTIVATLGQTGFVLSLHPLKPDLKRLDPIRNAKRLVSPISLWELVKQLLKATIIGVIGWPHVQAVFDHLTLDGRVALGGGMRLAAQEIVALLRDVAWAMVAVAIVDYGIQRRQRFADLKMTRQELKDEFRNSEGDPLVRSRIRSSQLAMSRRRMMGAVPGATVVVTNPTHVAVALRYDPSAGGAPRVVAVGVDAVAARIRAKAVDAKVPVVEAVPLARALWRSCEVGDEIPVVLYEAVAKVLAFVRHLRSLSSVAPTRLPPTAAVDARLLDAVAPDADRGAARPPRRASQSSVRSALP